MDKENKVSGSEFIIDINHIFDALLKRIGLIALVSLLTAALGFSMAAFVVAPKYSADILMYVNNRGESESSGSDVTSSALDAAQKLVKTYSVIIKSRTTLGEVIERTQLPYSYKQLAGMIETTAVNSTEIMRITVTCQDPHEAALIANAIAEVMPQEISRVIKGSSVEKVDGAEVNLEKVSPGIVKYTALGFMAGFVLIVIVLTVAAIMDNTVHDEDYIVNHYDYPLLAVVPDLTDERSDEYSYYAHRDSDKRRQK